MTPSPDPFNSAASCRPACDDAYPNVAGSATLVRSSGKRAPREQTPNDLRGRATVNTGLFALFSAMVAPAAAPFIGAVAILRAVRLFAMEDQGLRAAIGLSLGSMAILCGLCFCVLWGLMRPVPTGLIIGWPSLRHLPAVQLGFQQTAQDPFAFTPGSWISPAHHK